MPPLNRQKIFQIIRALLNVFWSLLYLIPMMVFVVIIGISLLVSSALSVLIDFMMRGVGGSKNIE